jgi:hypothetical protein
MTSRIPPRRSANTCNAASRYRDEGLKMGLPAKAGLTRLWIRQRPDVVQTATEGPLGWSALAAANTLRLPVASDLHTNFHSYSSHDGFGLLRRAIVAYLRKFHKKSAVTLVPTEGIRRESLSYGYENLEIIGRGVNTARWSPPAPGQGGRRRPSDAAESAAPRGAGPDRAAGTPTPAVARSRREWPDPTPARPRQTGPQKPTTGMRRALRAA